MNVITEAALVKRINRRLAFQRVKRTRSIKDRKELGVYYRVEQSDGTVIERSVNLVDLARKIGGVLKDDEQLAQAQLPLAAA